jgi:hypothetical protein
MSRDLRLREEAVTVEGVPGVLLVDALQRHATEEVAVGRRVDVPHRTARELALEEEVGRRRDLLGRDLNCGEAGLAGGRDGLAHPHGQVVGRGGCGVRHGVLSGLRR